MSFPHGKVESIPFLPLKLLDWETWLTNRMQRNDALGLLKLCNWKPYSLVYFCFLLKCSGGSQLPLEKFHSCGTTNVISPSNLERPWSVRSYMENERYPGALRSQLCEWKSHVGNRPPSHSHPSWCHREERNCPVKPFPKS